jgi:transcriptional regulator with XRE-family HTH domain
MDLYRLFIRNMKKWRALSGLSQKSLAEKCGTGSSYIRQIESGVATPSLAMVARIAGALEIEPFQLLYDDDSGLSRSIWERYLEGVEGRLIASVSSVIKSSFNEMKSTSGVPMPGIGIPGIEIPVSDGSNIEEN